jgi:hypothetical protein
VAEVLHLGRHLVRVGNKKPTQKTPKNPLKMFFFVFFCFFF